MGDRAKMPRPGIGSTGIGSYRMHTDSTGPGACAYRASTFGQNPGSGPQDAKLGHFQKGTRENLGTRVLGLHDVWRPAGFVSIAYKASQATRPGSGICRPGQHARVLGYVVRVVLRATTNNRPGIGSSGFWDMSSGMVDITTTAQILGYVVQDLGYVVQDLGYVVSRYVEYFSLVPQRSLTGGPDGLYWGYERLSWSGVMGPCPSS